MRHCVALLLLLFTASLQRPQTLPKESNIKKCATQQNTADSTKKPTEAQVFGSFSPQTPIRGEEEDQPYNAAKDSLYRVYLWAAIIGVAVALVGIGMLWYQSRHLQSQIRLQERGLRQWVNTSDWKVAGTGQETSDRRQIIEVSFLLSNETRAPITLIAVTFNSEDHPASTGDEGFAEHSMLLPNNPFRPTLRVPLTRKEELDYVRDGILLRIGGMIVYTDALEETWRQNFRIFLNASHTDIKTSKYIHTLHKMRTVPIPLPQPFWRRAVDWYLAQIEAMKNGESEND